MRQQIRHDPSVRQFEAYMDFSGALNSEIAHEKLQDNEFPIFENVDLSGRSSARRRTGRTQIVQRAGSAQGVFFYYRKDQTYPDTIMAVSGHLYVKRAGENTTTEIPITDGGAAFTFQTALPIEAVQYGTVLYVATGTKLVEVTLSGSTYAAVTSTPYTPTVMEAIYIGLNGLAESPSSYIQDGTGALQVVGVSPAKRTATINQNTAMTAFINKPSAMSVDYKWEYRAAGVTAWTMGRDWTNGAGGKTWDFNVLTPGKYDVQVTVRDNAAQTTTSVYVLSQYQVNVVEDKANNDLPYAGINTCRRILLHWDRIVLYGDAVNPYIAYVSDLQNGRYYPTTNIQSFDTGKQEAVTAMLRFQNMLIIWTKSTIQTLVGKAPIGTGATDPYQRYIIHDGIGCNAGWTPKVVGNIVIFQSEEGFHQLKPNPYRLETMNVSRIDTQVKSELPLDSDASALVFDSQYWVCFPSRSLVYRFYYERGVWVRDRSTNLNLLQFLQYGDDIYNLTLDGRLYVHDKSVYNDAGSVYDMAVETRFLDLSASFNFKKLKRLHVLAKHFTTHNVELKVYVQADSAIVLTPESGKAEIDENDEAVWVSSTTPNMTFLTGTAFGAWLMGVSPWGEIALSVRSANVRGKCRRVKVKFVHSQDEACELFGFGLEFKLKKV